MEAESVTQHSAFIHLEYLTEKIRCSYLLQFRLTQDWAIPILLFLFLESESWALDPESES